MTQTKAKVLVSASSKAGSSALPLVQNQDNILVEARLLHRKLKVKDYFAQWIERRIKKYGFEKGKDYFPLISQNREIKKRGGDKKSIDYHLTIDMAKELCMVEENDIGRVFRRYFIEAEKELRTKRLYAQTSTLSEISKRVPTHLLGDRKLYHLRSVQKLLGFSTRTSTNNIRKINFGLILNVNRHAYISEEIVRILMNRATGKALRAEAKVAKPVAPLEFFTQKQLAFGAQQRGGVL